MNRETLGHGEDWSKLESTRPSSRRNSQNSAGLGNQLLPCGDKQGHIHSKFFDFFKNLPFFLCWQVIYSVQFSSVQLFSCVLFFVIPWNAVQWASLSITSTQSLLKFMSTELVMPTNHLILCCLLLLLPSIFPSIRVFPKESVLCIRWPNYWSFSFSISPSN